MSSCPARNDHGGPDGPPGREQPSATAVLRARQARVANGDEVPLIDRLLAARQTVARRPYAGKFQANPGTPGREGPVR